MAEDVEQDGEDNLTYIIVGDYQHLGKCYMETDLQFSDRDSAIDFLANQELDHPFAVVAFDALACDVSQEIAEAAVQEAWNGGADIGRGLRAFAERHGVVVPNITR